MKVDVRFVTSKYASRMPLVNTEDAISDPIAHFLDKKPADGIIRQPNSRRKCQKKRRKAVFVAAQLRTGSVRSSYRQQLLTAGKVIVSILASTSIALRTAYVCLRARTANQRRSQLSKRLTLEELRTELHAAREKQSAAGTKSVELTPELASRIDEQLWRLEQLEK